MTVHAPLLAAGVAPPRRLVIARDPEVRDSVAAAARQLGWSDLEAIDGDLARAGPILSLAQPPALIVADLDAEDDPLAALGDLANHCPPEARLLAIGSSNDVMLFRALLDAGVADYLVKPLDPETLQDALARLGLEAPALPVATAGASEGKLIAVIGARGGCGATTIAASLGWAIANRLGQRALLFDLNLHFGTLAFDLGIEPGTALADLLASPDRLDERLIAGATVKARDDLMIVAAAAPFEQETKVRPEAVAMLATALRGAADWVIADVPRRLDASGRLTLRTADTVVLVAPPTLAGRRDAQRRGTYRTAWRAGAPPLLVVNGAGGGDNLGEGEFTRAANIRPAAVLPLLGGQAAAASAHALPLAALCDRRGGNPFVVLAELATGVRAAPQRRIWLRGWPWRRA